MTPLTQKSSIVLSAHIASIFYGKVGEFMNAMLSLKAFLMRSGEATTITKSLILGITGLSLSTFKKSSNFTLLKLLHYLPIFSNRFG
ncbi:hypothetical protein [Methanosarcina horonobensis]|uniref:hypothetical protein n=1 Tax=Methanosarcina horonobensis TaxID=418008 RepID=UPI000A43081E|nr:hypothetical protein [Methanosarcina horonobensis]